MDKAKIKKHLIDLAQAELEKAKKTYAVTQTLVKQGDLKSDGKYDTRATEANYLADGQRQRISDMESELLLLEDIPITTLTSKDEVGIGALIEIEFNHQTRSYYLAPTAGGTMLNIDDRAILVISVFSPIGREAIGLNVGDSFEVEVNNSQREYTIVSMQ